LQVRHLPSNVTPAKAGVHVTSMHGCVRNLKGFVWLYITDPSRRGALGSRLCCLRVFDTTRE